MKINFDRKQLEDKWLKDKKNETIISVLKNSLNKTKLGDNFIHIIHQEKEEIVVKNKKI